MECGCCTRCIGEMHRRGVCWVSDGWVWCGVCRLCFRGLGRRVGSGHGEPWGARLRGQTRFKPGSMGFGELTCRDELTFDMRLRHKYVVCFRSPPSTRVCSEAEGALAPLQALSPCAHRAGPAADSPVVQAPPDRHAAPSASGALPASTVMVALVPFPAASAEVGEEFSLPAPRRQ